MAISSSKEVKHCINIKRWRVLTLLLPLWKCQIIFLKMANGSTTVVELSPHHPKVKGSGFASSGGTVKDPSPRDPKVLGSSSTASLFLGGKTGWIKFLNMAISGSKAVKHYISVKRSRVLTPLLPLCIFQNILLNMGNYRSTMVELSPHHPKVKGSGFASSGSAVEDPSPCDPKVMG